MEAAAHGHLRAVLQPEGFTVGDLCLPSRGVGPQFYDCGVAGGGVTLRVELKASGPRRARTWRRSANPKRALKPPASGPAVFEFAAHGARARPSFMDNARAPGRSRGAHVLLFCTWEAGAWEFTPVALAPPLRGRLDPSSPGGRRLYARPGTWQGSKARLEEHFGAPPGLSAPLATRLEEWVSDVRAEAARQGAAPAPGPGLLSRLGRGLLSRLASLTGRAADERRARPSPY